MPHISMPLRMSRRLSSAGRAHPCRGTRVARQRWMRALAARALLATILAAGSARADDSIGLTVQWGKLVDAIRRGSVALLPEKGWQLGRDTSGTPADDLPWVAFSPHRSL